MQTEMVEKQKKADGEPASVAQSYAGPGDVECDSCTGRKRKALSSCLVCLVSYCEDHLKPHIQSPAFKKHKLVKACVKLQEKICSNHDKLIDIYCRTDSKFLCYVCMMNEHNGHNTVTTEDERNEKQNELKKKQTKFQQMIEKKREKAQELKQTMDSIRRCSQEAIDDSEKIFTELISLMEKRRSEVTELIRSQEKAELSRTERLLKQLQQEIADLMRTITGLDKLSHTQDHIHFLQSFPSLCASLGREDSSSITVNQDLSFDKMMKSLSGLKKKVTILCEEEINKIHLPASEFKVISPLKKKKREDFLKHFHYLTLDPNTAHRQLILSENNRVVTRGKAELKNSQHPDRFDSCSQVLCKEIMRGRSYWEVEWTGMGVDISVSYKDISRKGEAEECGFGCNRQSWSLQCYSSSLCFWHDNNKTDLGTTPSSRIGVYVDHSAGILSFYSISDTMKLLHRVHTTFTQPLYAGFKICYYNATMRLCDAK